MGLGLQQIRLLLAARHAGVRFQQTATLGRQNIYITRAALSRVMQQHGMKLSAAEVEALLFSAGTYAEPFWKKIGVDSLATFDASNYEGATHVHNMNDPVPADLHERFDCVVDGGSLEHIFQFTQALSNCMNMTRTGGHFIVLNQANNYLGHGFYQFSPELFFRALSAENGFRIRALYLVEEGIFPRWYRVRDPAALGRRGTVLSPVGISLFLVAQKTESRPLFARAPQQSDYAATWNAADRAQTADSTATASVPAPLSSTVSPEIRLRYAIPEPVKAALHQFRALTRPRWDPELFARVSDPVLEP